MPLTPERQGLDPGVPQQLTRPIAARDGVPTDELERFVPTFSTSGLAGWNIYPNDPPCPLPGACAR
ncbi:MAG: hypothetical protein ACYDHH_15125 [Solirubrobacteraceae bacterium]